LISCATRCGVSAAPVRFRSTPGSFCPITCTPSGLPPGDDDFSTRWRLIKTFFARALPKAERLSRVRRADGERGIWQRRFWEHAIRNEEDYAAHMDYAHFNPVRHGLVASPADWPYSTFRSCVSHGLYPHDWIGDAAKEIEAGERGS